MNNLLKRFGSQKLKEQIQQCAGLVDVWEERKSSRGFKANMDGLLEFSCRMETTPDEKRQIELYPDMNHGLHNIVLKDYQHQSIHWMIMEERSTDGIYRHFFVKGKLKNSCLFWYSPFLKALWFRRPPTVRGGILCEEMGLGKTIEIFALINSNPSPPVDSPYFSIPEDPLFHTTNVSREQRYPTKATLIIAPTSLVGQWDIEIGKWYLKKPRTYCYYGKRKHDPAVLASYDIVLTTYGILTSRKERQYDYPLRKCDWWRIVLDESHMIKSGVTCQAMECKRLTATNRWCVTGTPFNTNIKDIKAQLHFIGLVDPIYKQK